MEESEEKIYKSKKTVRDAMARYNKNIKENDPQKYNDKLQYHKEYNKAYYAKIKQERAQLKLLLQKLEIKA